MFLPIISENADLCQQSSAYDHNADLEYWSCQQCSAYDHNANENAVLVKEVLLMIKMLMYGECCQIF